MSRIRPLPALLALLAFLAAFSAHAQHTALSHNGALISVSASAESSRVPEIARISAGVTSHAEDARSALGKNSEDMIRVMAALRAIGIAERDIRTSRISIEATYRRQRDQDPVFTGYRASNTVTVKLRAIDDLGAVLASLVEHGANQINGPWFEIEDPDAVRAQVRLDALNNARQRADQYAAALGLKVVGVVSLDEGGGFGLVTPMRSNALGAPPPPPPPPVPAPPPVSRGESTIRAHLTVVFELGN